MTSPEPRFVRVSRRAFLTRSAVVGGLLVAPTLACSKSDEEVFADATTTSPAAATVPPTTATTSTTSRPSTATDSTTSTTSTTPAVSTSGGTFPSGAELVVDFTFAPASGGRVNNPFIAVWIEDPDGNLVDTISLWFQAGKGQRWLPDLRRWYAASAGASDTSMSGATRVAGSYTVAWDGTDLDGNPVPQGEYVLHIEAAREHGPYELVTGDLTIGSESSTTTLTPSGELTAASAALVV